MRADKLVAYYRVSTARQEASGLSLDAQRQAVAAFLGGAAVLAEFTETESGKRTDRPELARAIGACRPYGARLVIAKLDRLSRDAHFLLGLEKAGEAGRRTQAARASARVADLVPVLDELRAAVTTSLSGIAAALNARSIPAARGGKWSPVQVPRGTCRLVSSRVLKSWLKKHCAGLSHSNNEQICIVVFVRPRN